ncbi:MULTISPECIES: outer membrane-stress sensor serine endopeptidase DegS [Lonsdalea]|uniref:Outer membrane-stress sensor serine endopeptidase DegS n=2 Tax=Lonsdalea TaxID=1082702 RepID=A0ACD1JHH7_9GAMM|nr:MULTISPECIES: outer membrane-stress sensor serine endopeptidase DegS [Lonsdalea]OSM97528.1 outer membrane-stress sensor serine endopeptidase DegS [Lonsdalea populi]OSN01863.1 outer membrane-stress sensor serine endopeptidase DegS [Lonsdalea populi]QPQ23969.1 outer membrane-stress sensor serine endopeptidase DegS [Lonsdalea populi]RAT16615.1 outer membrane-stress sensor serine endopeptidase DegS [Lonsdalea quercina]RAT16716.1 outer membrane-stress sensor serine endopeptidase DegS [Lonsdalea 
MLTKLIRSALIGVVVAAILLLALPALRSSNMLLKEEASTQDQAPVSYYQGVRRAAPAVVNVYNRAGGKDELNVRTLGSGVIMNNKGYILTNKHVITDAEQIVVTLQDGRLYEALLVGSDSLTDLAVLKIEATGLPAIAINDHRTAHVGDVVMAIGNPYNLGQTITQGIISATGRVGLSSSGRQNFLQTDASINRGNSGGALVNTLGELVGINTLSFDKSNDGGTPEGIGFAIPVALATKVMGKLIRDGRVIRGYIGINGAQIERVGNKNAGLDRLQGIIVSKVEQDGPADKAGIKEDDLLLKVNNKPARSVIETMDQVAELRPGTVIPVVIFRDNKELTLDVTIQEFPAN